MIEQFWRLEVLIPAKNAISGAAYWTPVEDADNIKTLEEARDLYRRAKRKSHIRALDGLRLVRIEVHTELA